MAAYTTRRTFPPTLKPRSMQRSSTAFASGWRFDTLEPAANLKPHGVRDRVAHKFFDLFVLHLLPPAPPTIASTVSRYTHVRPGEGFLLRAQKKGGLADSRTPQKEADVRRRFPRAPRWHDHRGHSVALAINWRCRAVLGRGERRGPKRVDRLSRHVVRTTAIQNVFIKDESPQRKIWKSRLEPEDRMRVH
jgi:ribosomal protein L31E